MNLSPADDVLISVERPLGVDTPEQMVASILSKKVSAGSTHLVVDMPVGPSAKVRDAAAALRLRKLFEFVAARMGMARRDRRHRRLAPDRTRRRPGARSAGRAGRARGRADAPRDLRDKAVMLAGRLLEVDPDVRGGRGEARARELIASGAARRKLDQIIEAQGPSPLNAEARDADP